MHYLTSHHHSVYRVFLTSRCELKLRKKLSRCLNLLVKISVGRHSCFSGWSTKSISKFKSQKSYNYSSTILWVKFIILITNSTFLSVCNTSDHNQIYISVRIFPIKILFLIKCTLWKCSFRVDIFIDSSDNFPRTGYVIVQHQRMFEVIQIENEVSIIAKRNGRQIIISLRNICSKRCIN